MNINLKFPILFVCVALLLAGQTDGQDAATQNADPAKGKKQYAIAIHGGAGSSAKNASPEAIAKRKASLAAALEKGVGILESGGTSLDAVEAVIVMLEDDPQFNSGKGAVYNAVGSHELDASIMSGKDKSCGAVAGVSHIKNPIKLARLVMTETRHVLLSGQGAETFGKQQNVQWVEPSYFDTPQALRSWKRFQMRNPELKPQTDKSKKGVKTGVSLKQKLNPNTLLGSELETTKMDLASLKESWNIGTVGCVALDSHGDLAAGTSTGGMTFKRFGRVGDSPIVGAGTYADNETCAVSSTGTGEEYIRNAVAYDVSAQLKYKKVTLREAVDDNLKNRLRKGDGGLIAVDKDGNIAMGFNTGGMARAAADSKGRKEVIWGDK